MRREDVVSAQNVEGYISETDWCLGGIPFIHTASNQVKNNSHRYTMVKNRVLLVGVIKLME